MKNIHVSLLNTKDKTSWNTYVSSCGGSIYHLWEWGSIIKRSLRMTPKFFIAKSDNHKIVGILPLYLQYKKGGYRLINLPCTGYVNPVCDNQSVAKILLAAIARWATKRNVVFESSFTQYFSNVDQGLYQRTDNVCDFVASSAMSYADWREGFLDADKRRRLRRAKKLGIRVLNATKSDLAHFYFLYQHAMKGAGVASLPFSLFFYTYEKFKKYAYFLKAQNHNVEAYLWGFIFKKTMYIWKNAYIKSSSRNEIYYASLVESFIQHACNSSGVTTIDFSTAWCNGGLAQYKRRWGFKEKTVYVISNRNTMPYQESSRERLYQEIIKKCPFVVYSKFLSHIQ